MNRTKGLTGLLGERKGLALVALLVLTFVVAAFADTVLLSIDYTNPNATILGISESSAYAFVNQSGNNWTIWYNNASSGSFTVTANAQDNLSGIVNMTWPTTVSAGMTRFLGTYRQPISINTSANLTDYQIFLNVSFVSGKMNTDFSDLRFTNASGAQLPYWIENYTTSYARVWIKGNFTTTNGTQMYMYYGNVSLSSASNGTATFIFFDDFNRADNVSPGSLWDESDAPNYFRVSTNMLTYWRGGGDYCYSPPPTVVYCHDTIKTAANVISENTTLEFDHYWSDISPDYAYSVTTNGCKWTVDSGCTGAGGERDYDGFARTFIVNGTAVNTVLASDPFGFNAWISPQITFKSNSTVLVYKGNTYTNASSAISPSKIAFSGSDYDDQAVTRYYDNVRVRKYVSSEPTTSFGSEEPVVNSTANVSVTWAYYWNNSTTGLYDNQNVTVYDLAGNTNTSWNFFNVLLDNVAPTTTDNGSLDNVTWYNTSPVTINLTTNGDAGGSGINFTKYCNYTVGGTPCTPTIVGTSATLLCNGTCYYIVRYFSGDQVGNNETYKQSNKINFAIGSYVAPNVTADENTTIGNGSIVLDSGTNLTNATITGNSTIENTTITDSTVNATNVTDSSVSNSTVSNSTVENSNVTDSLVNMSDVNNSAVDNSTVFNSTVENDSNVSDSVVNNSIVDNSTASDSNITQSVIDNSTVTNTTSYNSNITDSTTDNSTVSDSVVANSSTVTDSIVANNSVIDNSTVANNSVASNSIIEDSTSDNSTIIDSTVNESSTITDSQVMDGSIVSNSTVANDSAVSNSTVTDSASSNSTITDSTVENSSTVIDSTVANNSVISNTNMTDSVADNSTLTNSTMQNSTASDTAKVRSNNINTTADLSTEIDTNATNSNLVNANLTLCSLLNSVTTNTNGTACTLTDTVAVRSNFTNFVADNCTIDNTDVSNSVCSDSIFNYTSGDGWNVDPSNITGSYCAGNCNVSNSNVTWSNISVSSFYNSNFGNSVINLSRANYSSAYNSNLYNSTIVNISVSNSIVNDSSLLSSGPSVISISTIRFVTMGSNYTIINSTLTNVSLYGSGTIEDSTITDSTLNDTSVYSSTITGMTSRNTTINSSTITNPAFDLNDSIINLANINDGMLVYGSITYQGTTYYGSRTLASIYGPSAPVVSNVQCANTTGIFGSCSDIGYGETLWKVRAIVTQGDYSISNVVFKLDNLDDGKTLFYGNWVERNGTEYRFYWNQPILDSGTFNLTVIATDAQAATASDYANWTIPFGTLGVVTAPSSNTNAAKNSTFTFNATYDCTIGECGDVNAFLWYNVTLFSASPSTAVNSSTVGCLGGMGAGSSCTVSWIFAAIGNKTQQSELFAEVAPINYSANVSAANSTAINITIINSAPTVPSIVSPISGSSVSNLTVNFDWSDSTDVDGDAFNYTVQVDNNSDYLSPEFDQNVTDSNATVTVNGTGTWYWRVQAYDAENASVWSNAFVIASLGGGGGNVTDTTPPFVVLNSPANNAYVQSGGVTFVYTPSEQLSLIANCSLYINDALNQTNSTTVVNNAENNFTVTFAGEASYNWTVECTDTSAAGPNSGNATSRVLNVDVAPPVVLPPTITYPSGQAEVKSGQSIIIDIDAGDSGSGVVAVVANCSSLNAGLVAATLQSGNGASGTWRAICLVSDLSGFEGDVNISAIALDGVGFFGENITVVAIDNLAPANPVSLSVVDYPADIDGVVGITWPNSTSSDIATFNIYRSNVGGFTPASGLLIASTADVTFTDVPPSDGTWYWRVTAVDNLGQENLTDSPQNSTLVDTGAPTISNLALAYPTFALLGVTQTRVKDGDVLNIRVDATDPQSISSVWVDVSGINIGLANETMLNIGGDTYEYNATIGGASGNQTIRIYANDTSGNVRNGVASIVAIDNDAPTALVLSDDGNFTATTTSIHASWSYVDDSAALGYQYEIYNNIGETIVNFTSTTSTDVTKLVSPPLSEGLTYYWHVIGYDGAGNTQENFTDGIAVDTTPPVFLFVNDDGADQSNTTALNATWSAQDLESGVSRYLYRVGEDNNFDGIIDAYFVYNVTSGVWKKGLSGNNTSAWVNVGGSTSVTANIDTMNAYRYYIEVKAENWAGVAALGRSDGILVTGITSCPLTLGTAGTYTLTRNLTSGGTCITIGASNVTVDCIGYTIFGTIYNLVGFNGTTIKNCVISISGNAIHFETAASYATITNNTISTDAGMDGIHLVDPNNGVIANNTLLNNSNGIMIFGGPKNNTIAGNTLVNNTNGIYLASGSNNTITNNIATSTGKSIFISGSSNNIITNNVASNGTDGIYLSGSNNTVANNNVTNNSNNGISLLGNLNNLTNNTASGNKNGISATGSNSTFTNNTVISNANGIYVLGTAKNNTFMYNTVTNNTCGINLTASSNGTNFVADTVQDNTIWDFYSKPNSVGITVINMTTQQNLISFTCRDIALKGLTTAQAPASDPTDYYNITKYINATNTSATGWLFLNFSYIDSDLTTANVSEATVRIWKYDTTATNWTNETFYVAGQWGVNAAGNYVFANITGFASTFAPFGRPNSAPSQVMLYAPANAMSTTTTTHTFEWNNATDGEGDTVTYELQVDDDVSFGSPAVNETNIAETSPRTSYTPVVFALGTYYWRVRAYDGALYSNWSDVRTLAITSPPSGGGGGGGGSTTVVSESLTITSITADTCANAVYTRFNEHGVQTIQLCVNHKVMNVGIQLALRGTTSTPAPGSVYKYMDIFTTGLNDEYVDNATFAFAVPKTWIAQNSIDYRHVRLYRWKDSDWHELATTWLSSDANYHYYSAVSPGLSVFAISGPQASCPSECQTPGLWATCLNGQTSRIEYSCSVDTGFLCEPKTVTKACAPELLCPTCQAPSDWSTCEEGVQTRSEYVCSAETNYQCAETPVARACEVPAACPVCPESALWNSCTEGVQSRSAYRCGPETNYACLRVDETRSCLPPEALLVTAAAIVIILGLGTVLTVRRRAFSKWARKVGKSRVTVPKITMPKHKAYKAEKIVKGAPAMPTVLPTIRPKVLRMPGKPKYICSVCGKPELLVHWCEECGKETCLEHIHKVGTKLMCDSCMKKKGLV